jgi:hypothetical protein
MEGYLDVPTLDHVLHTAISRKVAPSPIPTPQSPVQALSRVLNRSELVRQIQHSSQNSVLSSSRLLISVRLSNLKKLLASADQAAINRVLLQTARQLRSLIWRSDPLAYVATGIFSMVIFDAADCCRTSLQSRIESRLAKLNQRDPCRNSLKISIPTSSKLRQRYPALPILFTSGYSESSAGALLRFPVPLICRSPVAPRHSAGYC